MDVRLHLKSTVNVIGSVSDFTYKWSLNAGLSDDDATRLALALTELVTDIVRFAYRDEPGEFDVTFKRSPSTVEVIVHELGEPFNPDRHGYDPRAALDDGQFDGAGFALIRHLVDDFVFLNKGRGGKEFRLIKVIATEHIADMIDVAELRKPSGTAPPTEYVLAPLTVEDAEDVARLIYRTYGYTYVKEDLYFPKKIEAALEEQQKFGVIVRTARGEPVGYFAVLRSTDSRIGEVGEAVVEVAHRRRGIMTRMLHALIEQATRRGLLGLFGEAVTVHDISQRANDRFGFHSTALLLATFPAASYKGLVETYPQDISSVIEFLPLTEQHEKMVVLPDPYRALLTTIYHSLGMRVHDANKATSPRPAHAELDVHISYAYRHAEVIVRRYGNDLTDQVAQTWTDLCNEDFHTLYVDLPLDDPQTRRAVPLLRTQGFVFSGLMPLFHQESDYLRLQRLSVPLDFDLIHVYSDVAKRIKRFIADELAWTTTSQQMA